MHKSIRMNISETPRLEIRLFGSFDAAIAGQSLPPLRSRAEKWLLALFALRPGHALAREWLAATLWPDSDTALGLYNLRRCLTNLRKALGDQADLLLSPTPQTLSLDRARVQVDVADFDAAVAGENMESLERAVTLYSGPLLQECTEEWALSARIEREQAYLAALEALASQALTHKQPATAVRYLRLTIAADPLRETAHSALMQALADCGDYAAVTQVYRDLRLLLHRELNGVPAAETEALYRRLQQQAKQRALPAPSSPSSLPSRCLPVPLTTLVGRETDIADVVGWLQKARLVTLLGAGGVGKTRLAIAAAEILAPAYPDGVWFVALASLTDATLVVHAVARTLGVKEEAGRPLAETLAATLASRSLLLILDNCEHLIAACATLAENLLSCGAGVRLLATSREALGLVGEHRYHTPSLALPPIALVGRSSGSVDRALNSGEKDLAWLMEYGGMRLFVERAAQIQPAFRLTAQNASQVLEVVHNLDGIPLAIELAAARVRTLSVAEIKTRLHDRFRLLTGGSRTALPRQQTLRALIDWSYDLLTEREKRLLMRLSVFMGGWSLEAAEYVCSDHGGKNRKDGQETQSVPVPLLGGDVLDVLTALSDKSLVIYEERQGAARYRLLETIRQYASDRLMESGEATAYRHRHREFFLAWAEEADKMLRGPEQGQWLVRLETEHDNLRQALTFCLEEDCLEEDCLEEDCLEEDCLEANCLEEDCLEANCLEAEKGDRIGLKLGGALHRFWQMRGHLSEGRECLLALLARPEAQEHTRERGDALNGAGRLAYHQGDYVSARSLYEESLEIHRKLGNRQGIATALGNLGLVAGKHSDFASACSLYEESLKIHRELEEGHGVANSLINLGAVAYSQGDYVTARSQIEDGLAISRELGDRQAIAIALITLGLMAWNEGDYAAARALYEESLEINRELGNRQSIAYSLGNLALVAFNQGDYASARSLQEESLALRRELGDRQGIAYSLGNLALVALNQGDYISARSQIEESLKIRRELGDQYGVASALSNLGNLASAQKNCVAARALYQQSLEIRRELGDRQGIAISLGNLALVTIAQGDYASARTQIEESLEMFRSLGNRQGIAYSLEAFASLNAAEKNSEENLEDNSEDNYKKAVRLWGAAKRLREEIGSPLPSGNQEEHERDIARVRAVLDEKAFADAWESGRSMTMEQAIAYALDEAV